MCNVNNTCKDHGYGTWLKDVFRCTICIPRHIFSYRKKMNSFNGINTSSNLNAHSAFRFIAKIYITLVSPLLSSKIFLLMSEVKMHYERKYRLQGQIHLKVNDRDGPQLLLSGVHISPISLPFISCFNFWYPHTDLLLGNIWVSELN